MKQHYDQDYFVAMCKQIAAHAGKGEPLTHAERHMLAGQPFTSRSRPKDPFPKKKTAPPPEQFHSAGGMLF
jgi:hypothetical protein